MQVQQTQLETAVPQTGLQAADDEEESRHVSQEQQETERLVQMLVAGERSLPSTGRTAATAFFKFQQMQLAPQFPLHKNGRVVWVEAEP